MANDRIKEHEAITVSFAHGKRDSSNTMQLVEVFETLDGGDCACAAMVALIRKDNNSILWLRNVYYPMMISLEDVLSIKNKDMCWFYTKTFVNGSGDMKVHDHDH